MSEDQLGHEDNPFWDVYQSWSFPNLETEDYFVKTSPAEHNNNLDGDNYAEAAEPKEVVIAAASKGKKRTAASRKELDGEDECEEHIWTERERRKKMRNMFDILHSLLPHLPPKADKSTIVDEAVTYIKEMEQTLQTLQKKKLQRLNGTLNPNINPINYDPLITLAQQKLKAQSREAYLAEQGPNPLFLGPNNNNNYDELIPAIFKTWTSPNVILNVCGRDAQISICSMKKPCLLTKICFVIEKYNLDVVSAHVSSDRYRCMFMIHARRNGDSNQFQQAFPFEEMYKQAAAEIIFWVNA